MKMITQTIDGNNFNQRARQIRDQVSIVLTNWGLLPRFKRWRLTQDPDTGMVVLFGILNNRYIATHTSIPFSNYFDLRLLQDLSNKLQVQIVSCNSDGLRYAFILDRGRFGRLPTHVDYPFIDNGKLFVRVVYGDTTQSVPTLPADGAKVDDQTLVREGVGAFLKVFDDIKLRDDAALDHMQNLADVVVIEEEEFKKRVAEHEAERQRSQRMGGLPDRNNMENTQ
jgi:hypothetical protein